MDGMALMVISVSNVIPQHPPFIQKEEALNACKGLLHEIYNGPEIQLHRFECITRKSLRKNLADLNTFETSVSLRDGVKLQLNLTPLSIYICTHCPHVAQRC